VESHREFWKCHANLLECGKCNLEFSCVPSSVPAGSGIGASRLSLLTDPKVTKYGPTPVSRPTGTLLFQIWGWGRVGRSAKSRGGVADIRPQSLAETARTYTSRRPARIRSSSELRVFGRENLLASHVGCGGTSRRNLIVRAGHDSMREDDKTSGLAWLDWPLHRLFERSVRAFRCAPAARVGRAARF